jgi:hypothetical protein
MDQSKKIGTLVATPSLIQDDVRQNDGRVQRSDLTEILRYRGIGQTVRARAPA